MTKGAGDRSKGDAGILLRAAILLGAVVVCASANAFPSEQDVNDKLRQGLTADEIVSMFGEPGNGRVVPCIDCTITYFAPMGSRTIEKEGYSGVSIHFANGKVRDWQIHTSNPSYAEPGIPPNVRWLFWFFPVTFGLGLLSKLLVRLTPVATVVSEEVAQAFENRAMDTSKLPAEFRFITREMTLQEVTGKLGKPSRIVKVPIRADQGLGYAMVSSKTSAAVIVTYEYDLPYHAAVIVMPEFPFESQSRIRSVFYRPIQPELAEATE